MPRNRFCLPLHQPHLGLIRSTLAAACALAALLCVGCNEEEKPAPCPSSGVQLELIYATDDSVAIGATVRFWALPDEAGQQYAWSASVGRFTTIEGNYAEWKAPDVPAIAKITVVAFDDQEQSAALSVPIAVDTYLPRSSPTYTGASYCGLECHGVEGHGDRYDTWVQSGHARAYQGLEQDRLYHPPCADCHTVGYGDRNSRGWDLYNGGYDEVPVARLQGVQCENCHGPLADRYGEILPDHGTRATGDSLLVVGTPAAPLGCASCHEGAPLASCSTARCHVGNPQRKPYGKSYLSEWVRGAHDRIPAGVDLSDPQCVKCHTAQGFIEYLASGGPPMWLPNEPLPITCAACHAPHGSAFVADLRVSPDRDVCSRCHTDTEGGYPDMPHAPQEQMLAGTGGFEYAGADYPSSPHRNLVLQGDISHRGCAHCHYDETFHRVSHSFEPDARACVSCHPEANGLNFAWNLGRTEIRNLLQELRVKLEAASPADSLTEAFRRAEFNWRFVDRDRSLGAHNQLYARQLLESSLADFQPTPGQ